MVSQSRVRSVRRAEGRPRWFGGMWGGLAEVIRFQVGWRTLVVSGVLAAAVVGMELSDPERLPYRIGQRIDRPIVARVDFSRVNRTATDMERQRARQSVPNYYRFNAALGDLVEAEFRDLLAAVRGADSVDKLAASGQDRWQLDAAAFKALQGYLGEAGAAAFHDLAAATIDSLAATMMVQPPTEVERDPATHTAAQAVLAGRKPDERVPVYKLLYVGNSEHVELVAGQVVRAAKVPAALAAPVRRALIRTLAGDPATGRPAQAPYVFDVERTRERIAAADALPPVEDHYGRGQVLVAGGEIDAERLALLTKEHETYVAVRAEDPLLRGPWLRQRAGRVALALVVLGALLAYTAAFQWRVVQIHTRALGLAALFIAELLINRGFDVYQFDRAWVVSTATVTASILVLAYNQRFALGASALVALLATLLLRETIGLWLMQMSAAATAVLMLREIRTRLRLLAIGATTAVAAGLVAAAVALVEVEDARRIGSQAATAALAGLVGMSFVFVTLPLIERAFGVTTALRLLEWADTSQPLLKQLIQKAPGTWQHSHLLANMGEAAAQEIGANPLLVRVGAYYHDVGKMAKPEYFVENQQDAVNAHEKLSPQVSLLVILGHVKDGLALAREYGLPPVLQRFITEHHGTTVVRYFHHRAQVQASRLGNGGEREVDETEFRYPGPKPSSKETAILMLCDSVEGSVRSQQDPTPGRIEDIVHEITMARLMDGQFDECDLTLKELSRIEQSLVKSLCSIYHGRIAYPTRVEVRAS